MRYTVRAPGSLGECLGRLLAEASGRTRKQLLASGRVRVNGATARRADVALAAGDVVELATRGPRAALPPGLQLRHEDDELIVVDKPAGLLTIATEHERRRTVYAHLTALARSRQPPARVFVVHRLDRLASGLLVFATSPGAKRTLQAQFAAHTVERAYLAVVEGRVARPAGTVVSRLLDDAPGPVRQTRDPQRGRQAVTHWRVVRAVTDSGGATTSYTYAPATAGAAAHALTSVTYPDGAHLYFSYDAEGRLAGTRRIREAPGVIDVRAVTAHFV